MAQRLWKFLSRTWTVQSAKLQSILLTVGSLHHNCASPFRLRSRLRLLLWRLQSVKVCFKNCDCRLQVTTTSKSLSSMRCTDAQSMAASRANSLSLEVLSTVSYKWLSKRNIRPSRSPIYAASPACLRILEPARKAAKSMELLTLIGSVSTAAL